MRSTRYTHSKRRMTTCMMSSGTRTTLRCLGRWTVRGGLTFGTSTLTQRYYSHPMPWAFSDSILFRLLPCRPRWGQSERSIRWSGIARTGERLPLDQVMAGYTFMTSGMRQSRGRANGRTCRRRSQGSLADTLQEWAWMWISRAGRLQGGSRLAWSSHISQFISFPSPFSRCPRAARPSQGRCTSVKAGESHVRPRPPSDAREHNRPPRGTKQKTSLGLRQLR
jgi:hypothetical protein